MMPLSLRMGKERGMLKFCLEKWENILEYQKFASSRRKSCRPKLYSVLRKSRERYWGLLRLFEIGFSCKNDKTSKNLPSCRDNGFNSVILFEMQTSCFSLNKLLSHKLKCGKKAGNFSFNYPHSFLIQRNLKSPETSESSYSTSSGPSSRLYYKSLKMAHAWKT